MSYKQRLIELGKQNKLILRLLFYYYCYLNKDLTPPQLFNYVGGEEFLRLGKGYFDLIKNHGGVKPDHKILDIGCGIGRVALHFIDYLDENGRYNGFDIVKYGPKWCNYKIARKYPGFAFRYVDIYNKEYNKNGTLNADDFIFPYKSNSFNFAFATSVFTHMLPDAVSHYLKQIQRVLVSDGIFLGSFFILNPESEKNMPHSRFNFKLVNKHYGVINKENLEEAIAYQESYLNKIFIASGFSVISPILYGGWSGRQGLVGGQDIILLKKTPER
ncbi:class I SAM-dependent methyltransferase [Desulfococcaceae bacterium HSG9]|nr:class I SAM-dependent methyltransferase [Desulfococcaceae bacterium HSG9]